MSCREFLGVGVALLVLAPCDLRGQAAIPVWRRQAAEKLASKAGKKSGPLWRAVLTGDMPFGTKLDDVAQAYGKPQTQRHWQKDAPDAYKGRVDVKYREGRVSTWLFFHSRELYAAHVHMPTADIAENLHRYLDGRPTSTEGRAKAMKRIVSQKRLALGMKAAEVEALMGLPTTGKPLQRDGAGESLQYWVYERLNGKRFRMQFQNGHLVSIHVELLTR